MSRSDAGLTIGVDVGGTKVLAGAVDPARPTELLAPCLVPTPVGVEPVLASVVDVVAQVQAGLAASGREPATAIGAGMPALIDDDGRLVFATHLPGVTDVPVGARLHDALGLPVVVDNDANCAAVAEARVGGGADATEVLVVTLGTGIGGGIVIGGRVVRGAHGFAGEIGHVLVQRDGRPCECGRRGCWEQYASGNGLGTSARHAARHGRLPGVLSRAGELSVLRGEHVVAAALEGDPDASALLDDHGWWIAAGLADLVNVLDPGVVVLGGGLIAAGDLLLDPVRRCFDQMVIGSSERSPVPIVAAVLGPEAGAIGAALLAGDRVA